MTAGSELPESYPSLFVADSLPAFNARQAWTDTFSHARHDRFMHVGNNEILDISSTRDNGRFSHNSAELALIRKVTQTGTADTRDFDGLHSLETQLEEKYERLSKHLSIPAFANPEILVYLREFNFLAEKEHIANKISRAAGYIAARQNLWIVTRRTISEPGIRVSVARLAGLARNATDELPTTVRPVVTGKNGIPSLLKNAQRDRAKSVRPNVLDVIEGSRKRP